MSPTIKTDHFTYRVTWSAEDSEYVAICAEFPSLSWLAATPEDALSGIRNVVRGAVCDVQAAGELASAKLSS
jgi:predicted RNase H-like HicB family nuclease